MVRLSQLRQVVEGCVEHILTDERVLDKLYVAGVLQRADSKVVYPVHHRNSKVLNASQEVFERNQVSVTN